MNRFIPLSGLLIILLLGGFCDLYGQNSVIIKGLVIDATTKEALIGVNVVEIDQNDRFLSGTIADMNGNYVFKMGNDQNPIQFSYIGYEKLTVNIEGRSVINVELKPSSELLGEVVISGSKMGNDGITSIRDRATSVARLEMENLETVMGTSVESMMQGRFGNVDISSVSGDPGAGLNIRIRGTATLNARNSPLIVVNGIPYNAEIDDNFNFADADIQRFGTLIDVAPEDIESIEVLKDAASTAIWGSRAANGVLMIKTKRGIKSKPVFDYTFKYQVGKEPDPVPMLDGSGYAQLITEEHFNVDRNEFFSNQIAFNPEWDDEEGNYHNYSQNTDWVRALVQNSQSKQHVFSVRGGGDKSRYKMSVGHSDETGTTINNGLKKLTLASSLDYDLSTKLTFKTDIMYTRYDQYNTYDVEDSQFGNNLIRSVAYRKMPNMSIFDRDTSNVHYGDYFTPNNSLQGNAIDYYNPVAMANLGVNRQLRNNARSLFTLNYRILSNLSLTSTVTLDIFDSKRNRFLPYKAIGYNYGDDVTNRASDEYSKKSSIYTFNKLVYTPDVGDNHSLSFLGQFDTEETTVRWFKTETSKSASPNLQLPVGDKDIKYMSTNYSNFRSLGMYAQAAYKFKDKYMFMAGGKYEGNSKYSAEARWGFFPTLSGAWRLSEENFLQNASWMDDFKFRLSWGQTGNSPNSNYLYYNTYEAGSRFSYLDMQGVRPKGLELTSLRWETIDQINPGISFYGLRNRLNVEVDYFRKKTLDLYLENSGIPYHTGYDNLDRNDGEMENRGWEFSLDYKVIDKKDWKFSFNFNFGTNENIILRLPDNYSLIYGNMLENGNYKISITPGEPMGGFFGYRYLGVYKSDDEAIVRDKNGEVVYGFNKEDPLKMIMGGPSAYTFQGGDAKYDDINHDGKIDELDLVYLGDLNPKFNGGLSPRLQYKGWVVNSLLFFKVGQKIINQTRMDTEKMYGYENQSTATNWRWRREGDETDMPRALFNRGFNWLGSDRFVEDGSYLRLQSLSLSYDVSPELLKKLKLRTLRLYVTGYNLYTWTKYSGQDPDVGVPNKPDTLPKDVSRTPPSTRLMLGLNVSF